MENTCSDGTSVSNGQSHRPKERYLSNLEKLVRFRASPHSVGYTSQHVQLNLYLMPTWI
jgi:hypothetical protein